MSEIHPLAFVDPRAELGRDCSIGPFCYIGPGVRLGDRCRLHPNVTLIGPSEFGCDNIIHPHCTLGADPQDIKYRGGPTQLIVGDHNCFRENVTIHRGTEADSHSGGATRLGSHNLLMVGVHVAHDTLLGDNIIIANHVQIAGHGCIEDCVTIGGVSAMHHFVTIGRNAYVAGMTRVTHDVPPYMKVEGYDQEVRAVNTVGMERWQIPRESIQAVKAAFRLLYPRRTSRSPGRTSEALAQLGENGLMNDEHVRYLVAFLKRKLEIGIYGRVRESYRHDAPRERAPAFGLGAPGARS